MHYTFWVLPASFIPLLDHMSSSVRVLQDFSLYGF